MFVCRIAYAVELKVRIAEARLGGLLAELETFSKLDSVGSCLHAVVSHLARVPDGINKVWRERRLAPRKLHRQLAARLDRDCVVQQFLDFCPGKLVNEADLVCVHKAWIAHHVAAVSQIDRKNGTAPMLDRAAAVIVERLVVVCPDISARENLLKVFEEFRVDGHDIFEMPVHGAILDHQDLALVLDYLRLDLADLLIPKNIYRQLAIQDLVSNLGHALGA